MLRGVNITITEELGRGKKRETDRQRHGEKIWED